MHSICPYCAVGCGQLIYVKGGKVTHIEGDPASPISRGRRKARRRRATSRGRLREYKVNRKPYGRKWEELPLERARTRPAYDTAPRCPVWAPRSDEAGGTTSQRDMANADVITIMGSNMAQNHPVGFQ